MGVNEISHILLSSYTAVHREQAHPDTPLAGALLVRDMRDRRAQDCRNLKIGGAYPIPQQMPVSWACLGRRGDW